MKACTYPLWLPRNLKKFAYWVFLASCSLPSNAVTLNAGACPSLSRGRPSGLSALHKYTSQNIKNIFLNHRISQGSSHCFEGFPSFLCNYFRRRWIRLSQISLPLVVTLGVTQTGILCCTATRGSWVIVCWSRVSHSVSDWDLMCPTVSSVFFSVCV